MPAFFVQAAPAACGLLRPPVHCPRPSRSRALIPTPTPTTATAASERVVDLRELRRFLRARHQRVLTLAGYSGSGYEDPAALLTQAAAVLDAHDPVTTLLNIGATAQGIGAVYELAKHRGYTTLGIVSVLAREHGVALSPWVDHVFYLRDATWGGRLPGSRRLSPTSAAVVAASAAIVAFGGGDIARDEMAAARRAGKPVLFVPADLNHQLALQKAAKSGAPRPTDFRGAAHLRFARGR